MSNVKAENTTRGYLMKFWDKEVFIKQNYNEDFYRPFLYTKKEWWVEENSKKEIELTQKEWGQAMIHIQVLREKGIWGVVCTLLEWIWWEEKVVKSRKSIFWQLRDNWLRF